MGRQYGNHTLRSRATPPEPSGASPVRHVRVGSDVPAGCEIREPSKSATTTGRRTIEGPGITWAKSNPGVWLCVRKLGSERAARLRASSLRSALKKKGESVEVVSDGCELFVRCPKTQRDEGDDAG